MRESCWRRYVTRLEGCLGLPGGQKQETGPGTSIKRLSTELEIDRNTGIELVRNARVSVSINFEFSRKAFDTGPGRSTSLTGQPSPLKTLSPPKQEQG
jgi:hypothetical protein